MKKILVIEDAHALRKDIMEMLKFEGFDVAEAENGLKGVELARKYMPDLIICDIMMPELNGYEVLDVLRKDANTSMIPFIFLTAKTDKSDIRFGMASGADDYLTKPFKTIELLATIRARLDRKETILRFADRKLDTIRQNIITALPHELRTPLNTIIGFSEMLISDGNTMTGDQVVQWAQHISSAAQRLYRLIENYISYARVETMARDSQQGSLSRNVVTNPRLIIEFQVLQKAAEYHREKDVVLKLEDVQSLQIAEDDLGKIVSELMDNALKFSESGKRIEVSGAVEGKHYALYFRDYGRGMTPEMLASVGSFMQFERWLYEQQGAGLGLTIARRLVELYGGALDITSTYGEGTTVCVGIPLVSG